MKMSPLPRAWRSTLPALLLAALLGGCASTPAPRSGGSIIPAQLNAQTQKSGLFSQPDRWTRTLPGCKGECPKLVVDSLVFPGHGKLTALVDHDLASMSWLDANHPPPYSTIRQLEAYFWKTAGQRDELELFARTRYRNAHLTVLELEAAQYRTGMAHGISGTRFLIWQNDAGRVLTLDDLLLPGARPAFNAALHEAYLAWRQNDPARREDPENFDRMWPFVASDNAAVTDAGVVVKYQPYEIAPYVAGKPELKIPYPKLRGILRPEYLPPA